MAARCHLGLPTVIETHPVSEDGSPFPTLFWLTCPILVKRVSRLEAAGAMAKFNEELADDEGLRARQRAALDRYRARRDEHAEVEDSGSPPGGDERRVKCLHAHVAAELAFAPNPIGALTMTATGYPDCVALCVGDEA